MKIYIVDGYNLLWKLMPGQMNSARLEGNRQDLERKLVEFISLAGNAKVILVYDGRGGGSRLSRERWGVRICFAPGETTADEKVLDYAEEYADKGDGWVGTADLKDIGRRLGGSRATHIRSEKFIAELSGTLNKAGQEASSGGEEKPSSPKGEEIDEWLEEFDLKD